MRSSVKQTNRIAYVIILPLGLVALLTVIALLLVDYNSVERHYSIYQEALRDNAVGQGTWIPYFIPRSSYNIHDMHDVDINIGVGTFSFDPAKPEPMEESLIDRELSPQSINKLDSLPAPGEKVYMHNSFLMYINWEKGIGRWILL